MNSNILFYKLSVIIILASILFFLLQNELLTSPPLNCPLTYKSCSAEGSGAARTCCAPGYSCKVHGKNAWCSPDKEDFCPDEKPIFCFGDKGNACCSLGAECSTGFGYAFCETGKDKCDEIGGKKCGLFCCKENEKCESFMFGQANACSAQSCNEKETLCKGKNYNICCKENEICVSSAKGNPNCYLENPQTKRDELSGIIEPT